jgi:magnesium chelatase family protein
MLAQRFAGLLPAMSIDEALESAAVASLGGRFGTERWACARPARRTTPPARWRWSAAARRRGPAKSPWRTTACLFLDELPEFPRAALEALREPLESGTITISRAARAPSFRRASS